MIYLLSLNPVDIFVYWCMILQRIEQRDNELYSRIKSFILKGFFLLKKDLDECRKIRDGILFGHGDNPFYFTLLSSDKPDFSKLILRYQRDLEAMHEYLTCKEYMETHPFVSKFCSRKVGTKCDFDIRWSSDFLFSFLQSLSEVYFIENITKRSQMSQSTIDERFNELYIDYESIFYDGKIPLKEIIPLHNFVLINSSNIILDTQYSIKRISNEDLRKTFEMSKGLRIDVFEIGESPYIIERSTFEPIVYSLEDVLIYSQYEIDLYSLITSLRLFKKGFVSYSYVFHLKDSNFPIDVCKPRLDFSYINRDEKNNYMLDEGEVSKFLEFWNKQRRVLHEVQTREEWSNAKLALGRFNFSYSRPYNRDRFIDLCIALEVLLSRNDDIYGTLTHKYSLRLSRLLGNKFSNHKEYYKNMRELYSIRSKIVHADETDNMLESKTNLLETYVRSSLNEYLAKIDKSKGHNKIIDEIDYN